MPFIRRSIKVVLFLLFTFTSLMSAGWEDPSMWEISGDGKSVLEITEGEGKIKKGLEIKYDLKGGGWVQMKYDFPGKYSENKPIIFYIKAESPSDFEMKFVDEDGSNFVRKMSLKDKYKDWTQIVLYRNNLEYGWGGDDKFDGLKEFYFAVSGDGKGTIWIDEIEMGKEGLKASFSPAGPVLDPNRELEGSGFKQRRADELIPEDKGVLEWMKVMQDTSSSGQALIPSMEGNIAQTFNNSLSAMAFILKDERERAERILDFYSNATKKDNDLITLQNFYYKGEARGFYQSIIINATDDTPAYHSSGSDGRWMGDIAWLLLAYKYYEHKYESDRYEKISAMLKDLLISWYVPEGTGGYIGHGWRMGDDKLHEGFGHPEGNIDAYAVLKLCGEDEYANKISKWLDNVLKGKNMPLDLYTWQVLAYGESRKEFLNIPEYDLRYRKTLKINGKNVTGFYHGADIETDNIWLDGAGHMACAYFSVGDEKRGNFYSNQLDAFLMERIIGGKKVKALPYTANENGGYSWVEFDKGFISACAWYIFAKNKFNPMSLKTGYEKVETRPSGPIAAASSVQSEIYSAQNVLDGNPSTRWSSDFSDPQWLEIDLNELNEVAGLTINWEAAYAKEYTVDISKDKIAWERVFSTIYGDGKTDEVYFTPSKTKYIKITGQKRGTTRGYSVLDVKIKDVAGNPELKAASFMKNNSPDLMMDGKQETFWASKKDGKQWIIADFKKIEERGGVEVYWGDNYASDYKVYISQNGKKWNEVYLNKKGNGKRDLVFFDKAKFRYLKILMQKSNNASGYEIRELIPKGPDEYLTVEKYYELEASQSPPGYYPRWLNKEQSFWTVTGVDMGEDESLISEEGIIEPFKDGFSVTPFLFINGKLVTFSDVDIKHSLSRSNLPIPTVTWNSEDYNFKITAFSSGEPGQSATYVRYSLQNISNKILNGKIFLAVRPLQVNPPWQYGGLSKIEDISSDDSYTITKINGKEAVISLSKADNFGINSFSDGDITGVLAKGNLPSRKSINDKEGFASCALSYDFNLDEVGSKKEAYIIYPIDNVKAKSLIFQGSEPLDIFYGKLMEQTAGFWGTRLNEIEISFPDARLLNIFKSNIAYLLINRDNVNIQPGPRNYNKSFMRDGAISSAALLRLGFYGEVRAYLDFMCSLQKDDGFVPFIAKNGKIPDYTKTWTEYDSQGQLIYAISEYYKFTKDKEFLKEKYSNIKKSVDYIINLRKLRITDEYKNAVDYKRAFYGILPESNSHEGYFPAQHSYWDDFWAIKGLEDAKDAALLLDEKEDAKYIENEIADFRKALYNSISFVMKEKNIGYIPGCAEKGDFDAASTAIAIYPCAETNYLPKKELKNTFIDKYFSSHVMSRIRGDWSGGFTPYEGRNVTALLILNEKDTALRLLNDIASYTRPLNWNHFAEVVFKEYRHPQYLGDMPHTWIGAEFINNIRNILLFEEDDKLIIGYGIDGSWLEKGNGISVGLMPTYFGLVSYNAGKKGNIIEINIKGYANPKNGTYFRIPEEYKLTSVTINGKKAKNIENNYIKVPSLPAKIVAEVKQGK